MPTHAARRQASLTTPGPAASHGEPATHPDEPTLAEPQARTPLTAEQIASMLREMGETVELQEDCVAMAREVDGRPCPLALDVEDNGGLLRFYFPEFMPIAPEGLNDRLTRALLDLNQRVKLLRFGSTDGSGRIWVDLAIPVEDATITRRQLARSLELMRHALEVERPRLIELMQACDEGSTMAYAQAWTPLRDLGQVFEEDYRRPVFEPAKRAHEVLYQLAHYYLFRGRIDEGRGTMGRALAVALEAEDIARCEVDLGTLCEQESQFASAIVHYRRAVALEPTEPDCAYFAHNNLGYCLNLAGRHQEAEQLCRIATRVDPKRHNAYKNLGIALEGQGRAAEAASCYLAAALRCPRDGRALGLLEQLCRTNPGLLDEAPGLAEEIEECRRIS